MNTPPKIPANARNLNACVIGSSGSGKTRFWLTPQGRQSVKKLMNHYGGKSAMPYVGAPKDFDRIAKEFHVDYAFHKVNPGHYLLFFKANQADAITAAFQKYSAKVLNKEQDKASILGQLRKFTEQIRTQAKEKQRTREAVKDGR